MGHAIDALPKGIANVRRNPKLVVISFAVLVAMIPLGIVGGIVGFVLSLIPLVGQLLARLVVMVPMKVLVLGGLVGAAGAGFAGSVAFGDYTDAVGGNARSLFGAFAIYELLLAVLSLGFATLFVFVFGFGSALAGAAGEGSVATAGLGAGMLAAIAVAVLLLVVYAVVFQFLDVAVVLGDHDATGAFGESLDLVRGAPLSVLGYTVLRAVLFAAILLPGVVVTVAGAQVADVLVWVGAGITLLLYPVALAVVVSYHAAYYGVRLQAG